MANLANNEIFQQQFLLFVIDYLERITQLIGSPQPLSSLTACDAAEALRLASCFIGSYQPPPTLTMAQLQSIVAWQLNDIVCSQS